MPPKKVDKNVKAAKVKAADDKTFGLKNKNKSAKVQKYVQQVQQTVQNANKSTKPVSTAIESWAVLSNVSCVFYLLLSCTIYGYISPHALSYLPPPHITLCPRAYLPACLIACLVA